MAVQALVHTTGVVLGRDYIPLEVAYLDVTGVECVFLLTSPLSFQEARNAFPNIRPDAKMSTQDGSSLDTVRNFLHTRTAILQKILRRSDVVFGYKGDSYQKTFLNRMHLSHTRNVETLSVPSLPKLLRMYWYVVFPDSCPHHVTSSRCARTAVHVLFAYMLHQNLILPIAQQDFFGQ